MGGCIATLDRFSAVDEVGKWYALTTMSRHERIAAYHLRTHGIATFFPTVTEIHRWTDRRKQVEMPLFPGYLFIHALLSQQIRRIVLLARGIAGFVAMGGEPVAIPDEQIVSVERLLASHLRCSPYPFLKIGQRIRVRGGALDGIEGVLVRVEGEKALVVRVEAISRSLAVRLEGYDIQVA